MTTAAMVHLEPFRVGTMPRRLRNKGVPQWAANTFIKAFNAEYKRSKSDRSAYIAGYTAMGRALRKRGYRQGRDKVWQKTSRSEAEEIEGISLILPPQRLVILEEKTLQDAMHSGVTVQGIALIDNIVSQQGSWWERFYTPEYNERCMTNTNEFMDLGHVVTVYNTHGSALGGLFSMPDKSPIGKISEHLWREGEEIQYKMYISPTVEGKDVIQLLYDEVMGETSVRQYEVTSATFRFADEEDDPEEEWQEIEEMIDGRIGGIDFCDQAGVIGAGITKKLESKRYWRAGLPIAESLEPPESNPVIFGREDMDWEKITLAELLEHRPDILKAHVANELGVLVEKVEEQASQLATAQADLKTLQETSTQEQDALAASLLQEQSKVAESQLSLEVVRASQIGLSRRMAELLTEKVKTAEEIPGVLEEVRNQALTEFTSKYSGTPVAAAPVVGQQIVSPTGHEADQGSATTPKTGEEKKREKVVRLAGGKV